MAATMVIHSQLTSILKSISVKFLLTDRYWENGEWIETEPMEIKRVYNFAEVGEKDMYLLYHEELESLAQNIPGIKRIRFFMTFGQSYLTHLKALENVGMTSIEPIEYEGKQIIPLQFLKAVLPDPASLGPRTVGKTNIGCIFKGKKDGKERHIMFTMFAITKSAIKKLVPRPSPIRQVFLQ